MRPAFLYVLIVASWSIVRLAAWPIAAGDTDLWYHLNGGRYLFQHHAIPTTSYFSFVSPARVWVDYYWLFQALVYAVYQAAGYYGLVALRVGLYGSVVGLILWYLFRGRDRHEPNFVWLASVAVAYTTLMIPRSMLVRPHLFSYLFVVTALFLLEYRPRRAIWFLPVLSVLWANVHGITYPLMVLLGSVYVVEYGVKQLTGQSLPADAGRIVAPACLAMLGVLATPHGLRLLPVPFIPTTYAMGYIQEFTPIFDTSLLSIEVFSMVMTHSTMFHLLLAALIFAFLHAVTHPPLRLSHLWLAIVGVALLVKGVRFEYECALLALPLLAATPLFPTTHLSRQVPKVVYLGVFVFLLILPLRLVELPFQHRPRYPFTHRELPHGIGLFLREINVGGTVLNFPNDGGYLQWMLYPRYKIFMDMEIPFLFHDEDMFTARHIFADEAMLKQFVATYHPTFISAPMTLGRFGTVVRGCPQYVLVFFDDEEALYVDRDQHPVIAQRYGLTGVDVFEMTVRTEDSFSSDPSREPLLRYLPTLLRIFPEGRVCNRLAAHLYIQEGLYDLALPFTTTLITQFPDSSPGYRLRGDALKGLGLWQEALVAYQRALATAKPEARGYLYRQVGTIYLHQHQYQKAFEALREITDIFSANSEDQDLYDFAIAALESGRVPQGKLILKLLDERLLAREAAATELTATTAGASPQTSGSASERQAAAAKRAALLEEVRKALARYGVDVHPTTPASVNGARR